MVNIITQIVRPTPEELALARAITPATIHESQGRTGAIDPMVKPVKPGLTLCGPAVTVRCTPGDNMMLIAAINIAQPGDVLVVSAGGIAGLVIDACVRDGAAIREMEWPVFSTGLAMQGTVKETLGAVNVPIVFGGIVIHPGDIVSGDDDGVVCLKREDIHHVATYGAEKERKEAEMMAALREGANILELSGIGERLAAKGCVWA